MVYGAFFQALASFPTRKKTATNAKGSNQVYSASLVSLEGGGIQTKVHIVRIISVELVYRTKL